MKRLFPLLLIAVLLVPAPAFCADATQKVEIFVTSWCPYCRHLESYLKQNGVDYTRYDIEKDEKGARLYSEIGGTGVPVSRIGKKVVHGYDPEGIQAALRA